MMDGSFLRRWDPRNPAYNQEEAWPRSLFPDADRRCFREAGRLVCALAAMLFVNGLEQDTAGETFTPWILNQRMIACGAFSPAADLNLQYTGRFSRADYYGDVPYSPEMLEKALSMHWPCLLVARGKTGGLCLPVPFYDSEKNIRAIEPLQGSTALREYEQILTIRVFRDSGSRIKNAGKAEAGRAAVSRDGRRQAPGDREQAPGDREPAFGGREPASGDREPAPDVCPDKPVLDPSFPEDRTILVNEDNPLPPDYRPRDLVPLRLIQDRPFSMEEEDMLLDREAAEAAREMFLRARSEGFPDFMITSAYRSRSCQAAIYQAHQNAYCAVPGHSEHETGLAIDVESTDKAENERYWSWLSGVCREYGYILRYPADGILITKIPAEPWHFRYVGKEAAAIIHRRGWTLEEYISSRDVPGIRNF